MLLLHYYNLTSNNRPLIASEENEGKILAKFFAVMNLINRQKSADLVGYRFCGALKASENLGLNSARALFSNTALISSLVLDGSRICKEPIVHGPLSISKTGKFYGCCIG